MDVNALELLDFDCWRLVFRKLNAEDHFGCRLVCKPFHQLLEEIEFQQKWKFDLILPHLIPYLKSRNLGNVSWKNLHNVRLTCLSWRESVDKYASEMYEPQAEFPRTKEVPLVMNLYTEDFEAFQKMFGKCDKNPFPSRTVCIRNLVPRRPDRENEEERKRARLEHIERVGSLLDQFGRNVSILELFEFQPLFLGGPLFMCKLMKRITNQLPNLKVFIVDNEYGKDEEDDEQEVATFIEENALAALPKLQALEFGKLDKAVEDYLLEKYASQLTYFQRTYPYHQLNQVHMQRFKNVQKLSLEFINARDSFEILRFLESPLKFLNLCLNFYLNPAIWNVDKVLSYVRHLPLECLKVDVLRGVVMKEAGLKLEEYINENIQTLRIRLRRDGCKISFNFLEGLPKLEKLELLIARNDYDEVKATHPQNLPEIVRLNEYLFGEEGEDLLYRSNVWEKVPSLKTLTLGYQKEEGDDDVYFKSIYTREKYEDANN